MTPTYDRPWDKNLQLLLVAIIAFNAVPLFSEIPVWVSATTGVFLLWKTLHLVRGVPRPPRYALWGMAFLSSIGIFATYGTIIGQEAASALLVVLTSFKVLETNRYRDAMIVILTSYFLLMAHLLTSQSLLSTVYMATDVMLITSLMFQAHKRDRRGSVRSLRPVMKLLGFAIPVWIFLFVAFPRFSSGLWNAPTQPQTQGGFAENLDPGGVSHLTDSDEPAFRATFSTGNLPSPERMYWRGAVLTVGDGLKWSRPNEQQETMLAKASGLKDDQALEAREYEISLEPTFRKWVFLLDYPSTITTDAKFLNSGVRGRFGFIFEAKRDAIARAYYHASSIDIAPIETLTPEARAAMLQLPKDLDPRILSVVRGIQTRAARGTEARSSADSISDEILEWLTREGFRYTKEPGALAGKTGALQLATFLFETKRGFCEHFAAAFATLARAAGIPARVTVGFQGGKLNDIGDYLLVRSLDAHAWTEVWRDDPRGGGQGRWVRVDPTSVVAPLRLAIGGDFNLLDSASRSLSATEAEQRLSSGLNRFRLRMQLFWDAGQTKWNSFLNEYDFEFQKNILSKVGLAIASRWMLALIMLIGVSIFIGSLNWILRRRAKREDPLVMSWRKFCRKLERAGLESRAVTEGPLAFGARARSRWPEEAPRIEKVVEEFCSLRYGPDASAKRVRSFERDVRRFNLDKS